MDVKRNASRHSGKGPAVYLAGSVRIDPLFQSGAPARAVGASVTTHGEGRHNVLLGGAGAH